MFLSPLFTLTVKDKPALLPTGTDALEAWSETNPDTSVLLSVKWEQYTSDLQARCLESVKHFNRSARIVVGL